MPKRSAEEKVLTVFQDVEEPLATGEVADELSAEYTASTIRGAISSLRKQGQLEKVKQGVYRLPRKNAGGVRQPNSSDVFEQGDPIYDTPASAGDGMTKFTEKPVGHMPPSQSLSSAGREVFWMPVVGDSMGERYQKHSLVPVAKFDTPATDISADDVYVIRLEGAIQIKRLQRLSGQRVRIISDNDAYPNQEVQLDEGVDFEILGRVLV